MLRLVPARFRRWRLLATLCLSALPAGLLTPTIRLGVGEDGRLIPRG
ncbi:MAG: hypothetical protein IBX53_00845 [Halomonas sp.]|nr:hypothetical protein [Halomonas sp.]MBE0487598.1 hypothetical protein [Halomonas sp.]